MSRSARTLLLVAASLALLALIAGWVGFRATAEAVRQAGFLAFAVIGLDLAALLALQAWAWAALNRPIGHRVPYGSLASAVTVGMATNVLTPWSYLAGEPAKVLYAGRKTGLPYTELAGTVVLAKYLTALSFLLFFGLSTLVAALSFRTRLFHGPNLAAGLTLLVLAAGLLALCLLLALALVRRWCPLTWLVGGLARLGLASGGLGRLRERAREMEHQVARVFCEEGRTALRAFALIALSHAVIFVKPALFFLLGGSARLTFAELSLLFVAGQALLAFQCMPSGAGTLEAVMLGVFALLNAGVASSQVMAYVLCMHCWDGIVVIVGAILATRVGIRFLGGRSAARAEEAP